MKVYLSPSDQHGNLVADHDHSEADHCLLIANACKEYLIRNGIDVAVGDNTVQGTYKDRVNSSNSWGADLHVCIHTNAGGGEGTLMLAWPSSVNNAYVDAIYNNVAKLTPTKDRGVQGRSDLYEIKHSKAVCAYLECEFHDSPELENWIDDNVNAIGREIARAIVVTSGGDFYEGDKVVQTSGLYRVQVGAFATYINAKNLAEKLEREGYDTYIKKS